MTSKVSLFDARQTLSANSGALQGADAPFFKKIGERFEALKEKSSHFADFRRLSADLRAWANTHANKSAWKPDQDQPVMDGVMAWIDLVDIEIENRVIVGNSLGYGAGRGSDWVNAETGQPIRLIASDEKFSGSSGAVGVGIGDVISGMIFGAKSPEVKAALSEGTDSAGGYSVPTHLLPNFIDRLRAKTQFINAGARTMMLDGGTTKMVRIASGVTAGWRAESAAIAIDAPAFDTLTFSPKNLAVIVKLSRELLADSVNISAMLEAEIIAQLAVQLDYGCLFGDGTSNSPVGLFSTSGIQTVSMGTNGATPTSYDDLLDVLYQLELYDAGEPTAAIMHPRSARTYRKLKDSTGQPLQVPEPLDKLRRLSSTSVPIAQTQGSASNCSTILTGNFKSAILTIREGLNIRMLTETYAATGEVAFVAHLRADVGFEHAKEFCALIGVKP